MGPDGLHQQKRGAVKRCTISWGCDVKVRVSVDVYMEAPTLDEAEARVRKFVRQIAAPRHPNWYWYVALPEKIGRQEWRLMVEELRE